MKNKNINIHKSKEDGGDGRGKMYQYKPPGKTLVFGRQPTMPWHKVCICGHGEKSHNLKWCLECDCEEFKEAGKNDR